MAKMTFRFTTECEMQISGDSYEDIYLQFKEFMHGNQQIARQAKVEVCPPETVQIFFEVEHTGQLHEIDQFKGSFEKDIRQNCSSGELSAAAELMLSSGEGEFHTVLSTKSH